MCMYQHTPQCGGRWFDLRHDQLKIYLYKLKCQRCFFFWVNSHFSLSLRSSSASWDCSWVWLSLRQRFISCSSFSSWLSFATRTFSCAHLNVQTQVLNLRNCKEKKKIKDVSQTNIKWHISLHLLLLHALLLFAYFPKSLLQVIAALQGLLKLSLHVIYLKGEYADQHV